MFACISLDHFQGIVIIVSHDRYFLDRTVSRIFAFQPDGHLRQYEGGYTDFLFQLEADGDPYELKFSFDGGKSKEEKKQARDEWKKQNESNKKLKFTYQEQRDYETIEAYIAKIEERLEQIETDMGRNAKDFVKLNELLREKEELTAMLEERMNRWMYLEDLAEKIAAQSTV